MWTEWNTKKKFTLCYSTLLLPLSTTGSYLPTNEHKDEYGIKHCSECIWIFCVPYSKLQYKFVALLCKSCNAHRYFACFQEKLFHNRLLQGMPGCASSSRWDGKISDVDKTITWGRTGGLGTLVWFLFLISFFLKIFGFYLFIYSWLLF